MNEFEARIAAINARAARRAIKLRKDPDPDDDDTPTPKMPGEDDDEDPLGGVGKVVSAVLPALLALDEGHSKPSDWDDDEASEIPNTSQVGKILRARRR